MSSHEGMVVSYQDETQPRKMKLLVDHAVRYFAQHKYPCQAIHVWLVLAFLLIALTPSVAAENATSNSKKQNPAEQTEQIYHECGERWGFPNAIADCVSEQVSKVGAELEAVYKRGLKDAGASAFLLRDSQRAWLRYQQMTCKYTELHNMREGRGVARALAARCSLLTTLRRLEDLRSLTQ